MTKIQELETKIEQANRAYWTTNNPIMSDIDYDTLVRELKTLDPNNALIYHIGGTRGKYRHNPPMLSLDKAYTKEEVITWMQNVSRNKNEQFTVQPKYDGLAGKIEGNKLLTRGDGDFGEDVTASANHVGVEYVDLKMCGRRTYKFQPYCKLIDNVEKPFILGEMLIKHDAFEEYCASGKLRRMDGAKYSNPRNAVAGFMNQKDLDLPEGIITFVPYDTWSYTYNMQEIEQHFENIIERLKDELGTIYPIDGIVFKLADAGYSASLGNTAHHPKGQIAFKFTNAFDYGILKDVVWQSGKEVLTPVAVLEHPIVLSDCYVTRATCHNLNQFKIFNLRKGDRLRIEKAGDIIPKITGVEHLGDVEFQVPDKCPICKYPTMTYGTDLMCANGSCSGKLVPRMVAAAKLLRIDGLGPVTCTLIHDKLHVNELWELYQTNYCKMIGYLPGFTDYSADQLYRNLQSAIGNVYEHEVLAACCIPGIGPEISRKIFESVSYGALTLLKSNPLAIPDLENVIGPVRAMWLRDAFRDRFDSISKMFTYLKPMKLIVQTSKGKICLTGKFDKPKSFYKDIIETAGYSYTDTLTDDVKYLVTNALDSHSTKCQKAQKKGIPIITIEEMFNKLGTAQ